LSPLESSVLISSVGRCIASRDHSLSSRGHVGTTCLTGQSILFFTFQLSSSTPLLSWKFSQFIETKNEEVNILVMDIIATQQAEKKSSNLV